MPYISAGERPAIDRKVEELASEIVASLRGGENKDTQVSVLYRASFIAVAKALLQIERGKTPKPSGRAGDLAVEVFGVGEKDERGAWLGRMNYALTRLIQRVPEKMVDEGAWKDEFRYWLYAMTVGALERSAIEIHSVEGKDWPEDGLVGVLVDVKDEYKRRVNSAYEMVQIRRSGDCYTTRYRTELAEFRDRSGKVSGYVEVMKEFESGR